MLKQNRTVENSAINNNSRQSVIEVKNTNNNNNAEKVDLDELVANQKEDGCGVTDDVNIQDIYNKNKSILLEKDYNEIEFGEEFDEEDDEGEQEEDDEEEEENNDDDDYDEEEEEEEKFVSPTVQVKHSIKYEYDEKKFELVKGENLFLINKTNQDWWLCLRLDENLTFFVPASYVVELEHTKPPPSMPNPPPRPPPPPPNAYKKLAAVSSNTKIKSSSASNTTSTATAAATAAIAATASASTNAAASFTSSTGSLKNGAADSASAKKPEVKQRQLLNYSNTFTSTKTTNSNPINRKSFMLNPTDRVKQQQQDPSLEFSAEAIISDLDECLNREEASFRIVNTATSPTSTNNMASSQIIGNSSPTSSSPLKEAGNYKDDRHIYQNIPNMTRQKQNRIGIFERAASKIMDNEDEEKLYEYSKTNEADEEDDQVNEDEEDDEAEEEEDDEDDHIQNNKIKVPKGWKVGLSKCKRKVFYNDFNKEKWYLHSDTTGKHYFYNAEGKSVWELEELNTNSDQVNGAVVTSTDEDKEKLKHFCQTFDDDLHAFNNLCSRLSFKQNPISASGGSELYPSHQEPNVQFRKNTKKDASDKNQIATSGIAASSYPTVLTYTHKAPNGLNASFKCVKLAENGKKCRKKTIENYRVVLESTKLLLIKELKGVEKLELLVDIKGGKCYIIENPKQQSGDLLKGIVKKPKTVKKDKQLEEIIDLIGNNKNGFMIETLNGFKILLIHESLVTINEWASAINSIITQIKSEFSPIYEGPELLHATKLFEAAELLQNRAQPVLQLKSSDQQKARSYLNNNSGNSKKECVYGSNLMSLCKREKRNTPLFVEEIILAIEAKGLDIDGIYRISGNLAEVQKVRHQVDQGKYNFKDFDIHVLCGALKTFFRELEEPLVPFNLHEEFLYSTTITDKQKRFENIFDLIKRMPPPHRETLRHVCRHLLNVVEQSAHNRMNVQNVALVFGPNIMRSNPINDTNNGFNPHIMTQNILVEYILTNFKNLFSYPSSSVYSEYE